MRRVVISFLVILFCLGNIGCAVSTSEDEVTIKTQPKPEKKKNTLFTKSAVSRDLAGILQEPPGKYPKDDDEYSGTLAKQVVKDLETLPSNMKADVAFDQLIYLLGRDYQELEYNFVRTGWYPLSESRKNAPAKKENLKVNIVLVIEAGKEMKNKIPGTDRTKMDLLKLQLKSGIEKLKAEKKQGISYHVMIQTHAAYLGKYTPLIPINEIEKKLLPEIDEILPGGGGDLITDLSSVEQMIAKETAGNVLNHIFLISTSHNMVEPNPNGKASKLLHSDAQAHVHVINYGVKDEKTKVKLKAISQSGMGEYMEADPELDAPFHFGDQTNYNEDGFNPRAYSLLKSKKWAEIMVHMKVEQYEEIDLLYKEEYEQLKAAANKLEMNDTERQFLLKTIETRKNLLTEHYKTKMDRVMSNLEADKKALGL